MKFKNLVKVFDNEIMEFFCQEKHYGVIPPPVPAFKHIPNWWKKIPDTYEDAGRDKIGGGFPFTAKKCMPLLDAQSFGYIIPLQGDLGVLSNIDRSIIKVNDPPFFHLAEFHHRGQIGGFGGADAIKFLNYWTIKTKPGWSTLFVPPINAFNPDFTCLSGLVDTDRYVKEVNFPALWHTPNFDGTLKAGTPLVTAIPVKRDSVSRKPRTRIMTPKEAKNLQKMMDIQFSRLSYYSNELREKRK